MARRRAKARENPAGLIVAAKRKNAFHTFHTAIESNTPKEDNSGMFDRSKWLLDRIAK